MNLLNTALVSWSNGTLMIGVFAVVAISLIIALLLLINSEKNPPKS